MYEKQQAIIQLITSIPLKSEIKGLDDLFNSTSIFEFFYGMISENDQILVNIEQIYEQNDEESSYEDKKIRNFKILSSALKKYIQTKGLNIKSKQININKIVKQQSFQQLFILIKYIIKILMNSDNNTQFIQKITQLSAQTQQQLKEIIEEIVNSEHQSDQNYFLNKIDELEQQLLQKQKQQEQFKSQLSKKQQQNKRLLIEISNLNDEIDELKRKNEAYEQLDTAFNRKDKEIEDRNKQIWQLKLSNHNQKLEYKGKIAEYEKTIQILNAKIQKYEKQNQIMRLKQQLQEKNTRIKLFEDKLEKQKVLSKFLNQKYCATEQKFKKFEDEKMNLQIKNQDLIIEIKNQELKIHDLQQKLKIEILERQKEKKNNRHQDNKPEILNFDVNYQFNQKSEFQCTNSQCQKNRQDVNILKKKCLEFAKCNQELRNQKDSKGIPSEELKKREQLTVKLSLISNQNLDLKQRLHRLSNNATQYYQQQLLKQKKKMGILKQRLQELDESRGRQIQILVSSLHQLQLIIQQYVSNGNIIEILRKLK